MEESITQDCCPCGSTYATEAKFCHMCGQLRAVAPVDNTALGIEAFAQHAAEHLSDMGCLIVLLQPWSEADGPPPGVLTPAIGGEHAFLDEVAMVEAMQGKCAALVPCTFLTQSEETAAQIIVQQLALVQNTAIFLVFLTATEGQPSLDDIEEVVSRHGRMIALGVDDVITNPDVDPQMLRETVRQALVVLDAETFRIHGMLAELPQPMSQSERWALEDQHQRLIWHDIPAVFMKGFPPENPDLVANDVAVGNYRRLAHIPTPSQAVFHARNDESGLEYAIKAIMKSTVITPPDLECIYREFRFLSELSHPNIAHLHEILHSTECVYLVIEYAGPMNLEQLLMAMPGQRLDADNSLDCFRQLARGLAHCHEHEVVHRKISVENLVLRQTRDDGYHCCIIDFSRAVSLRDNQMSNMVCGSFPCMAPEMAMGHTYMPKVADCWSAGVVLLEMGGGMSSLVRSVACDLGEEMFSIASRIYDFFQTTGNHAVALSYMGGIEDSVILRLLEMTLVSMPCNRHSMLDCLSSLSACP